jgi:hypothetical protein
VHDLGFGVEFDGQADIESGDSEGLPDVDAA